MKWLLLGYASFAALSASGAFAQNEGETLDAGPDRVTVYATKNPMPAFDFPGQVSVIERDLIDDFNPSAISDLFAAIPGAQFDGGPRRSGEVPSVRGLLGEGVLVLFDGARQSFLSGHDGRFFVDPDLIRSVEVVRGPSSALYGSGALGGVIAIRTINASDFLGEGETFGFSIGGGYQSVNEEWRGTGTAVWRSEDGTIDLVGNVTYRESGDIELGNDLTLPSDDEIVSSLVKGTWSPSDEITLSASWIRFGGDSIDPNNPQGTNIATSGNENVFRDIDGNTVQGSLRYAPKATNLIDLNIVGYYTKNEVEEDEVLTDRVITREVETKGVSFDNRSRFDLWADAQLTLTYGGEVYVDEQIGRDNTTEDGTRGGVPDARSRFYGAFVQAELALNDPLGAPGVLTIIPGARWDRFENEAEGEEDTQDEAVSPKIGVSYKPIEELILFGNWAEAFRAPSFNELYADGIHFEIPDLSAFPPFPPTFVTNFFVPNEALQPEESQSWEVGAGADLKDVVFADDTFVIKASYFQADVTNLIDLEVNIPAGCFGAPFPPCGSGAAFGNVSRNVNVTDAEIDGVELEFLYDSDYFYLRGNFSHIDGENADTGAFVGILTPDTVFIDAGIRIPDTDLRLGSRVTFAGDFTSVNDPMLERDGFTVADIYLVWQPSQEILDGLRVDLGVDNVGDTDYEVVAAGVSQPGRNYKAAIRWRKAY